MTDRDKLESRIKIAKQMLLAQGVEGTWNSDSYMHGLYNGMEFIVAIMENREPVFRDPPEEWVTTNTLLDHHLN